MPRIARGLVDGFTYHVINRGNGKKEVFHKKQDYQSFVELLKEARKRYNVEIFAYCLMPNHFHLVIKPIFAADLSRFMQWLMTSHVRRYHGHYKTEGHVWQGRYKSFIIQEDEHLFSVLRYVEQNPIRAGLVNSIEEWLWSSYHQRIDSNIPDFTDDAPIELPTDWFDILNNVASRDELNDLRRSVNRQTPFGSREWQIKICKTAGLESTLRPRGRPRLKMEKK